MNAALQPDGALGQLLLRACAVDCEPLTVSLSCVQAA